MKRIEMFNLAYDDKLMEINHYKKHPQMMPYVGEDYDTYKILIISESHYVPDNFKGDISNWYDNPTLELVNSMKGNTNTRGVINNFFDKNRKGHRLFHNINSALKNGNKNIDLKSVAWYNFYQKPAKHKKEFKKDNSLDKKIAIEVFEENIKILDPKLIFFVSKNAFGSLQNGKGDYKDRKWCEILKGHKFKNHQVPIQVAVHPNCSWWNRKHGQRKETGKQQFERKIRNHFSM
ncbi:hypothetical protein [Brumimicrobium oceani]|uniref:Uracil-DNA glycosylase-like domain-containing protein n=1 Tax=Brumimicrobium oceani TaxID=2100725 RepID=A0A2U2XER1_9FLAO|nr:hypothetical protein [Brumimicrobium oceani]PWH86289.1 hypothetical protein DIT68_03355 [Brumimicrobium oceani]